MTASGDASRFVGLALAVIVVVVVVLDVNLSRLVCVWVMVVTKVVKVLHVFA